MNIKNIKFALISLTIGLLLPAAIASAAISTGPARDVSFSGSGGGSASLDLQKTDLEETIYCPDLDAWHLHGYENTTGPKDGYEYYMIAHELRIYLHDDFMENVDLDTLECSIPTGYTTCDEGYTNAEGGTDINLVTDDTSAAYPYIEWDYGVKNEADKTLIAGYNDYDGDGVIDTEDAEKYRTFGEIVDFDFKSDVVSGASATTTSAIKVRFWRYDQSCGDFGDEDCWEEVAEDGVTGTHWNTETYTLTTNYECEEAAQKCAELVVDPSSFGVDDIYSTKNIEVTAYDTNGNDMTSDTAFKYEALAYGGGTSDGYFGTGWFNATNSGNPTSYMSDNTVGYRDSTPGDKIYIYEKTSPFICKAVLEIPYCSDLSLIDPASGSVFIVPDSSIDTNIEIQTKASTGEDWPYDVNYSSSTADGEFDGNSSVYTTDDWTIDHYTSSSSGKVSIGIYNTDADVAGRCSDEFSYILKPEELACLRLDITIPTTDISVDDMNAGNVEITWESYLTDGSINADQFLVRSSNPSGIITDLSGNTNTGSLLTSDTTIYYTGNPGDEIVVSDWDEPFCVDKVGSTPEEESPYCEDLSFTNDYPYEPNTGQAYDITVLPQLADMYDESTMCFDWTANVANLGSGFVGTMVAENWTDSSATSYNGQLTLEVNETGGMGTGNPATAALNAGVAEYTGTVCVENFEEGNHLSLYVLGEEAACSLDFDFPPLPPRDLYCEDLEMAPNSVNIDPEDADAGTVDINITYSGNAVDWTGILIIESTAADGFAPGAGDLFYTDGSPSEFSDGHLEIPVTGPSGAVYLTYVGGLEGDTVYAYIDGEEDVCSDLFSITKGETPPACYDFSFDVDTLIPGTDANVQLCTESDLEDQTAHVLYLGCDEAITYNGTDYYGELVVDGLSGNTCFNVTLNNLCEDAAIEAYIEDWEDVCWDEITIEEVPEALYCQDLSFDLDDARILEGEDLETELTMVSDLEDNTVVIEYTGCDESMEVEFDGTGLSGYDELRIPNIPAGTTTFDVTFNNMCADAEISAYVAEAPEVCADELSTKVLEVGEFNEYIFTFNFIQEQNAYSREHVFFSHDEDRAFYTLEYDPAGSEGDIVFRDNMWDDSLEGRLGDGSDSGGYVHLATSYDELTDSNSYEYKDILKFGFGDSHEANSNDLAATVEGFTSSDYMTFIPYIKFNDNSNRESVMIGECDGFTDQVCYEPSESPEHTGRVVIRNAGSVKKISPDAVIRVRFVGVVDSTLTRNGCSDINDDCLTEAFSDNAEVKVYDEVPALTANAKLVVLCSYLVTRNAGDVYLEVDLRGGSDISCIFVDENEARSSEYRNSDALIILNNDNTDKKTATSYCDSEDIGSLSSYVCEIIGSVSDLWTKSTVESTTESRVSQATRNAVTTQAKSSYSSWSELYNDLYNHNNPNSGVLYYKGNGNKVTLGDITVPEGAWTLIVENADLVLNGDIEYADSTNINDIPSIAFVVLGGDIYIGRGAHELSGVFYTDQSFDGDKRDAVDDPLTFYGSVYGHIQPLLDAAKYVGSPNLDGGGIVVRYDSRILLNTPPGLSEYVDVNTEKGVNR